MTAVIRIVHGPHGVTQAFVDKVAYNEYGDVYGAEVPYPAKPYRVVASQNRPGNAPWVRIFGEFATMSEAAQFLQDMEST